MSGKYRKELSGGFRKTTNNRMELMAVIVGLESLKRPCQVTLYSDSKYVVDSVTRGSVLRWQKKNWFRAPGERAKNIDLWKRFLDIYQKHQVEFRWVKGHAGIKENERCDELAVAAAQGYDLVADVGYLEELRSSRESTQPVTPMAIAPPQPDEPSDPTSLSAANPNQEQHGLCRKCQTPLLRKETKKKAPKPGQAYVYDWYLFCPGCGTMFMVDAAKRVLGKS
jgi:ribonuclease HI